MTRVFLQDTSIRAHRHSRSPSSNIAQSAAATHEPSASTATWLSDAQMQAHVSTHLAAAARWQPTGSAEFVQDEGSAHVQQLTSMYKQNARRQEQLQLGPDGNSPNEPQPGASASEFLPDKELSWSLNQHQHQRQHQRQQLSAQEQLPAYNPSSSAACAFLQSESQEQMGPCVLTGILPVVPENLLHGRHSSAQGLLSSDEQSQQHASQAFSMPCSNTVLAGMQDRSVHDLPSSLQSDLPLVEHATGQAFMNDHLEPLSQPVPAHQQAAAPASSHRHAFERPMGLSSFAMPFMNAPHSSHAMLPSSAPGQRFLDNHAVPMDVSQDHSFSSASSTHPDLWSTGPATLAEQAVPPHLKPPVILISQVFAHPLRRCWLCGHADVHTFVCSAVLSNPVLPPEYWMIELHLCGS